MGYVQIDGVKDILVNEKGQVREELRTLPWDSDRIEYTYDEHGNKKNEWPLIVVDIDEDGTEDKRLLPALVLKEHGELPRKMPVSRGDFEAKNGKKLPPHCNIDNIEYVGDGSFKESSPYKAPPEDQKGQEEPEGQQVEHKTAEEDAPETSGIPDDLAEATNEKIEETEEVDPDIEEPEEEKERPDVASPNAPDKEPSDLMKGSKELTAKRSIEIIRNFEYEELLDVGFYTEEEREDGPRVTVEEAWKTKKKNS